MTDTMTEPPQTEEQQEQEGHSARNRRQNLSALKHKHGHVAVKAGTEQASAMVAIKDECLHLAQMIESRCNDGPDKSIALRKVMEAQMWAIHSISHR